jgi:hypothetical protein
VRAKAVPIIELLFFKHKGGKRNLEEADGRKSASPGFAGVGGGYPLTPAISGEPVYYGDQINPG